MAAVERTARRDLERRLADAEDRVAQAEQKLRDTERKLARPDVVRSPHL
jgi:hypothetical protein